MTETEATFVRIAIRQLDWLAGSQDEEVRKFYLDYARAALENALYRRVQ